MDRDTSRAEVPPAREWVTVGSVAAGGGDANVLSFDLTVARQRTGSASLEIDSRRRPKIRRQTVQFPSGTQDQSDQCQPA